MKYLFALLLFSSPVFACVHSVDSTDTYVEVCTASDACRRVFHSELPSGPQWKKEDAVAQAMQDFLDVRLELISFDPVDPDKALDPNCENSFWGDDSGAKKISLEATHMVFRSCIIEDVLWLEQSGIYTFTIRTTDRCQ